jgi:DeoR family suf operon transcriptional repressor
MQTTKQQILALLKRTGSATVEEAAGALSVASMTARQHLVGLERDGLVAAEKVRRSNGRPHYLYTLTSKGEETFPRHYDLLAQVLLDEVAALDPRDIESRTPAEKRSLLVQRTADRLAERYRLQVEGRSLEARVAGVTAVLQSIGGFAEWLATEGGYEIRDYNCVFSRLMPETANGCEWHVRLLNQLLKWPVRHEHVVEGRVQCCRYLIDAPPAAEARTESEGSYAKRSGES